MVYEAPFPSSAPTGQSGSWSALFHALSPVLAAAVMLVAVAPTLAATPDLPTSSGAPDPFAWLEDIHGARALAWVKKQNARTAAVLEHDSRYDTFHREALALLTAEDRIADPDFLGKDIENFWQDATHVKGIWRRTAPDSYASASPAWETLLDLDALSKEEGRNWIFKGDQCLAPADRLCLVRLSDGGGDAVEIREYDTRAKAFVAGGFRFASGKQDVDWLDADTLLIARDWGLGTMTQSGYPFVIKRVRRGAPPAEAVEVFRGAPEDVGVSPRVFRDAQAKVAVVVLERHVGFFETEYATLDAEGATHPLDLPRKSEIHGYLAGRLVVSLNEDWAAGPGHPAFAAGSLVAFRSGVWGRVADRAAHRRPDHRRRRGHPRPGAGQAARQRQRRAGRLCARRRRLDAPAPGPAERIGPVDHGGGPRVGSRLCVGREFPRADHPVGRRRRRGDGRQGQEPGAALRRRARHGRTAFRGLRRRRANSLFPGQAQGHDAGRIDSDADVRIRRLPGLPDADLPSRTGAKLWLERGGAYVLANIRGGGEFGPAWHEAARRENRQRAFDDFAAVARDLIARKITSPRRLGIYGRSNGGVLTSVSITQHPDLFNAAVIESPLIDMLRYNHLSAGASWVAEYGDPDVAADRAFIAAYSAYGRLKPGVAYPEPYITTNTEDDRVHPGHARKFAAEFEALGLPFLYYENTFGGHANNADPELNARRWARHYVYLARKLMD